VRLLGERLSPKGDAQLHDIAGARLKYIRGAIRPGLRPREGACGKKLHVAAWGAPGRVRFRFFVSFFVLVILTTVLEDSPKVLTLGARPAALKISVGWFLLIVAGSYPALVGSRGTPDDA